MIIPYHEYDPDKHKNFLISGDTIDTINHIKNTLLQKGYDVYDPFSVSIIDSSEINKDTISNIFVNMFSCSLISSRERVNIIRIHKKNHFVEKEIALFYEKTKNYHNKSNIIIHVTFEARELLWSVFSNDKRLYCAHIFNSSKKTDNIVRNMLDDLEKKLVSKMIYNLEKVFSQEPFQPNKIIREIIYHMSDDCRNMTNETCISRYNNTILAFFNLTRNIDRYSRNVICHNIKAILIHHIEYENIFL